MSLDQAQILEALRAVEDPDLHKDIVSLGFVQDIEIEGATVRFKVELTTPACPVKDILKEQCEQAVLGIPGVESVEVEMTARVRTMPQQPTSLPGVKHVVAVASGKGGVGKSTVTLNVAAALAVSGAKVGLMDADVYGPSIPQMMGLGSARPETRGDKIVPLERFGIKMMSLGCLLEEGQAVLWRGPMVAATVKQLISDVDWGDLDYLLVDLPPGTGDAPMSLAQTVPLSGVVIVSTPNAVASEIAGKSTALFERLSAPVIGVVENMGAFVCPCCNELTRLFAGPGGERLAAQLDTEFLGSVPLDPGVCESGDEGLPALLAFPGRPQADAFRAIAKALAAQVSVRTLSLEQETASV